MIHCGVSHYPFFPAYTGTLAHLKAASIKTYNKGRLWASPESILLQFRVSSEPFLYPSNSNIHIPSQVLKKWAIAPQDQPYHPTTFIFETITEISMFLLSKATPPMIWSVQDKHWQLGIFSSARKTSPIGKRLKFQPNSTGHEFLIRVMQYFLEHSMGLVQPILCIVFDLWICFSLTLRL